MLANIIDEKIKLYKHYLYEDLFSLILTAIITLFAVAIIVIIDNGILFDDYVIIPVFGFLILVFFYIFFKAVYYNDRIGRLRKKKISVMKHREMLNRIYN
ncbi:MAG: hypothetical protein KKF44_03370 [Nanoarchaeota archaeon]|nr:hypothetical protein [Nanoarchaeota archaeon]